MVGVDDSDKDITKDSVVDLSMPPIRFLTLFITSSKREFSSSSTGNLGEETTPEIFVRNEKEQIVTTC